MSDPAAHAALTRALDAAGRRWRWRCVLQGSARVMLAAALAAVVAIAAMDLARFQPDVVSWARAGVYLLVLLLGWRYLVVRVPWTQGPHGVAEHLERRDPSLDALLITAAEVAGRDPRTPLATRLFEQAAAVCRDPAGPTLADGLELRRARWLLALLVLLLGAALLLASAGWRHGASLLAMPWRDARVGMPYAVQARPGDVTVMEGSDLEVTGEAIGFRPESLTLFHRVAGTDDWVATPMLDEGGTFHALLASLSAPLEYYLEAETVVSPVQRVSLQWLPRVKRVDHDYRYPAYTGLAARRVEGGTGIAAVSGTRVQVRVLPDTAPASGELVLDGERRLPLVPEGEELLLASLSVDEAARYRIELKAGDGTLVAVTPDYPVTALPDMAPSVSVLSPTGESRVTAVEEMEIAVRADDDVSLRHVELVLSVNGGPQEVVSLPAGGGAASVESLHTLYLETRELTPGDLISFHARASDGVVARTAIGDIHFMEVRPFDRDYSRGRSGGQQGGGGGQQDQNLSAQQRDLVIALFRLARDSERLADDERVARLTTLSEAQARIRDRVEAIVRRLRGRAMVHTTPGYKMMLEEMPRATAAMLRVEALLAVPDPDAALPPAREALSHLQRADAAFREVQVTSQRGTGGQGRADNQDLSRLFELEIDRFRNRYSDVQRAQAPARQQEVDETLRKLEELARRQRQEVERARRRGAREDLGGSGAPSQQALAREMEALLRRLERLSREQSNPAMAAAREALQQAARAMQDSAAGGGGGSADAAREALDRIREAREALRGDGPARQARELEQARRTAQSLAERQERVRQRLAAGETGREGREQAPPPGDATRQQSGAEASSRTGEADADASASVSPREAREGNAGRSGEDAQREAGSGGDDPGKASAAGDAEEDLDRVKEAMQADARRLQEALDRIAGSRTGEREAVRAARRAAGTLREEDVEGRLRRSREELAAGIMDPDREEGLGRALEQVREQVAEAARAAAAGAQQGQGRGTAPPTREQMRALMRALDGLRQQLRDPPRGDGSGPGGRDAADLRNLSAGLDRLRGPVASNAGPVGDLEALIEGVNRLADGDDGTASRPLLDAVDSVERALAEALKGEERTPAMHEGHAPAGYDTLVDEYYRRLGSRTPQ